MNNLTPQKQLDLLQQFIHELAHFETSQEAFELLFSFIGLYTASLSSNNAMSAMILNQTTFDFELSHVSPNHIDRQFIFDQINDTIDNGSLSSVLNEGQILPLSLSLKHDTYNTKILFPLTSISGPLGYVLFFTEIKIEEIPDDLVNFLKIASFQLSTYLKGLEINQLKIDFDQRLNNEIQRVTQQLEEHNQELERLRRDAELERNKIIQQNRTKSLFLASISHELRTPLNSIVGFTDLLHAEDLPSQASEYINFIQKSSEGLLSIINDIMEFTQVESDSIKLDEKSFDIISEVENVINLLEASAIDRGIKLNIEISGIDENRWHLGDPLRLKQVLIGLINNALKNTYSGYIKLWVIASENSSSQSTNFKFVVEDTGAGISPKKLDELFQVFEYQQNVRPDSPQASGLGLVICKKLIDIMGGKLEATSTENRGSEFYFTIELSKSYSGPTIENNEKKRLLEYKKTLKSKRALVVEDNIFNRELITKILGKWGIDYIEATNGREALDQIYSDRFDFILMDYQMPIMDGIEATNYIRIYESKNNVKKTPIIALTANGLKEDRHKFIAAGMDEYLIKPFKQLELLEVLEKLIPAKQE